MFLVIFILLKFHFLFLSPYIVHCCALEACLRSTSDNMPFT